MPEVILPCPECGDDECIIVVQEFGSGEWSVHCGCGHAGRYCATEKEAIKAHNALPRALRWTHEPPKVAGWYWCRLSRLNMPRCVEVYGSEDGLRFGSGDNWREPSMSVESEGFEWAGPIPLPVEG